MTVDLTSWQSGYNSDQIRLELVGDDREVHHFIAPLWMAEALGNAILGDVEMARRTRRDEGRRMVVGYLTEQVFCEPCYLEIDSPGLPAITRRPDPNDGEWLECCCCKFRTRNREDTGDCSPVPCSMVFDQGADTD